METKSVLVAVLFIAGNLCYSEQKTTEDDSVAMERMRNSQIILTKDIVNAQELAGCLVLEKPNSKTIYLPILPEQIRKNYKAIALSNTPYSTMLSQDSAVKVGFLEQLGIALGVSASSKKFFQVSINDVWRLDGPSFIENSDVQKNVFSYGKVYRLQGYSVKYNQSVQYSLLTTSQFESTNANLTSTLVYFDVAGQKYAQASSFIQKELISIAPVDISFVVDAWDWKLSSLKVQTGSAMLNPSTSGTSQFGINGVYVYKDVEIADKSKLLDQLPKVPNSLTRSFLRDQLK